MKMKGKEFLDKDVYAEDEKIGKVKEVEINLENWKVTHLEVELTRDAAESVLGAKKHGVRNMLATSALESGVASWNDRGLNLRIPKKELHAYLKPVVET
jgi:sporulation protein YlmC with PRC-barrel domain